LISRNKKNAKAIIERGKIIEQTIESVENIKQAPEKKRGRQPNSKWIFKNIDIYIKNIKNIYIYIQLNGIIPSK
jgi:hypothetical protein